MVNIRVLPFLQKFSIIIIVLSPGKPLGYSNSYRLFNFVPLFTKIFQKPHSQANSFSYPIKYSKKSNFVFIIIIVSSSSLQSN